MKTLTRISIPSLLVLLAAACGGAPEESSEPVVPGSAGALAPGAAMPPGHPPIGNGAAPGAPDAAAMEDAPVATVLETMNSVGYTYARLAMDGDTVWAAGPSTGGLEVGDRVRVMSAMGMRNFEAKSLGRTFDRILFLQGFPKYID